MSEIKKVSKKLQGLIDKLGSSDEKTIVQTIKLLENEGHASVLKPMHLLFQQSKNVNVSEAIVEFYCKLSSSEAIVEMIQLIREEENQEFRKILISSCWQNKLDFSNYLPDFVACATSGDFLEAFECLTVIENLEGPFEESQILESQLYLKEYLETGKGNDAKLDQIISEIAIILKDFDQNLEG